jgi:16S rRNA (uracil1498-N3)-methyltransferase
MYFYLPSIENNSFQGSEVAHFISCRIKPDQEVYVTDLKGNLAKILVLFIEKKKLKIEYKIISKSNLPKPPIRILYQAILDKAYLEKLIEILPHTGFSDLILFEAEYSLKSNIRLDRLQRILERSCEQSQNTWMPNIQILKKMDWNLDPVETLVLEIETPNQGIAQSQIPKNFIIGPEGGFSPNEKLIIQKQKFQLLNLGTKVLPSWLAGFGVSQRLGL